MIWDFVSWEWNLEFHAQFLLFGSDGIHFENSSQHDGGGDLADSASTWSDAYSGGAAAAGDMTAGASMGAYTGDSVMDSAPPAAPPAAPTTSDFLLNVSVIFCVMIDHKQHKQHNNINNTTT